MKKYIMIFCTFILFSCSEPPKKPTEKINLTAQGSSFSIPMTSLLFKKISTDLPIKVDFTANNSYEGIQQLIDGNVDFAVSDVYLTDEQEAQNPDILHIPVAVAGINFAYNINKEGFGLGQDDPIYLTPEIIAKIFNKQITRWNDPEIIAVNNQVAQDKERVFPDLPITVIHRNGISGDTYLLSKFLTKAVPQWARQHGIISNISWDIGVGEDTALDMMKKLIQTDGAFTYTTMIYGIQNNIPLARIKNFLGTYGRGCNFRSTEAMKVATPTADNRVDLTYPQHLTDGKESAVATGFMYILVKKEQNYNNRSKEQAQAVIDLITWLLSPSAQRQLEPIYFAALTKEFREVSQLTLKQITYNGEELTPTPITKKKK